MSRSREPYYDLAGVYAFLGEKGKAYKNLRIFNLNEKSGRWIVKLITEDDPLFESISDVEAKFQAEHERVRQCLNPLSSVGFVE